MALSDYDTAAEKIAALKAATLDPSLLQLSSGGYTESEITYIVLAQACFIDGKKIYGLYDTCDMGGFMVPTNDAVTTTSYPIVWYVKDSDIIYANPVDTYQDRLIAIKTATPIVKEEFDVFTTGSYGSVTLYIDDGFLFNGGDLVAEYTTSLINLPLPASTEFKVRQYAETFFYFDVPADW